MDVISDRTDALRILPEAAAELCTALFRNSPAGIYITRDGKFIYTNIEFRHVTGYSQDELSGKDYQRLINPRYRQMPKQNVASLFEEDENTNHEFKITTRDGKKKWISEKITYFKYGGNWLTLGHWLDISSHHSVEKAWREAERRFQLAFEDLSTGLTIIGMDGIFLKVNKSFCDTVGYEESEILESRFDDILPLEDREAYGDIMALFLSLEKPALPVQRRLQARDGRLLWVAMSISLIGDSEAGPSYFIVHFQDITEQKRIEDGLKDEERLYRSVVDLSLDPVAIADLDCRLTHVSQKLLQLLGYEKTELLGRNISSLVTAEENAKIQPQVMEIIKQGKPAGLECNLAKKTGAALPTRMNVSCINNAEGTPASIVLSLSARPAGQPLPGAEHEKQAEAAPPADQPVQAAEEEKRPEAAETKVQPQPATILQSASTAIILINEDTTIAAVNTAFETLSGYTGEEIEGKKSWIEFVAKEDQSRLKRYYLLRLIDPESAPDTYEFKFTGRDGNVKDVVVYISPRPGSGQQSVTLLDLAGYKKATAEEKPWPEPEKVEPIGVPGEGKAGQSPEQLHRTLHDVITAMSRIIEMRDPYTFGHQKRVSALAGAIAREMGLSEERLEGIEIAAKIHDIGKVYVPMEILSKPGRLSSIERQVIQAHAQGSYDILTSIEFPWPVADIALQHHERMDGSGYPRGLKGDEISLEAKILMVADVVEAMASHRPYRPSLGAEAALDEISGHSGTLYDPEVAGICLRLFREKGFSFEEQARGV
jgi:PAS domain S-box-containing protein/putative nucleotidyltransferase with HDIG domain